MAQYTMVLDTETTSLDKPFCYDIGYVILDMDNFSIVKNCHYVVEQNWHNLPLFESAYYKEKRPLYIDLMRKRKAAMDKWGYIMRSMARDIRQYSISDCYAYNSDFDDKVITFNCDWFKCNNPIENIAIHDIWGYASEFVTNLAAYTGFCEEYGRFTDTGNYKGSAEVVYQFLADNPDFVEAHMGLYDSQIEAQILMACIRKGATWAQDYKVKKILTRAQRKPFTIKINGAIVYHGEYIKKYVRNDTYSFTTIGE